VKRPINRVAVVTWNSEL